MELSVVKKGSRNKSLMRLGKEEGSTYTVRVPWTYGKEVGKVFDDQ